MKAKEVRPQSDRELLQELACVLKSHEFQGSYRAQNLLRYLVETALSDRSDRLKERTIGIELFHRDAAYDTGKDGIVRVAASDVRKRLANYYSRSAGARNGAGLRIILPSGSYVPLFEKDEGVRNAQEPLFTASKSIEKLRRNAVVYTVTAFLALACIVLTVQNWRLRSTRPAGPNLAILPWSQIGTSDETTTIAMGDLNFVVFQQLTQSLPPLDSYTKREWLDSLGVRLPKIPTVGRVPLTLTSHAAVAASLSGVLRQSGRSCVIRSARSLQVADFRADRPIILIGSALSNPWVSLFEDQLNFRIVYDMARDAQSCVDAAPRAGESPTYTPTAGTTPSPGTAYALISLVPNLIRKSYVLIVSGTNIESTEAAGDLLKDLPRLAEALRLRGIDPNRKLERLQLLLRVQCLNGTYSRAAIIADRIDP